MRGVIPEPVRLRRDKLGYNAPLGHWLRDGLGGWLWDVVNEPEFVRSERWNGRALLALAREKRDARTPWRMADAHAIMLAATAHWWLTRWLRPYTPA